MVLLCLRLCKIELFNILLIKTLKEQKAKVGGYELFRLFSIRQNFIIIIIYNDYLNILFHKNFFTKNFNIDNFIKY